MSASSSLEISGWNDQDMKVELQEILETFSGKSIKDVNNFDQMQLSSALEVASLIYLTSDEKTIKSTAFKVAEMLEFLTTGWCGYARSTIEQAISENEEGYEDIASEVRQYFEDKFNAYGFGSIRTFQTFNSKTGNVICSNELKIMVYSEKFEAANFIIFAEMFLKSPFDYIDAAQIGYEQGMFDSVEDYFDYLIEENTQEWGKNLIKSGKLTIDYNYVDEQIVNLVA